MAAAVIFEQVDPDSLYPARLAGRHGWAAWGLTRSVDDRHVELLVPADGAKRWTNEIAERIATQLTQPMWPNEAPTVRVDGRRVTGCDARTSTTVDVVHRPWYLPAGVTEPGDVVDVAGWPLIDEATAVRDRFEATRRRPVTVDDVDDVVGWVELKAAQGRVYRAAPGRLTDLLTNLRRTAPETYPAIDRIIDHARRHYDSLSDKPRVAAAFQTLAAQLQMIERSSSRTRTSPQAV